MADDIKVVGSAINPFEARDMIKMLQPDVLTLDVEMPKMDGIAFLENLMRLRPMPVVMVSTLTTKTSEVTLKALELGAIDFVTKPSAGLQGNIGSFATEVQEKIRIAATANVRGLSAPTQIGAPILNKETQSKSNNFSHIIAIGASTGGTEAVRKVLAELPVDTVPVVIAQHIPESFSASFAKRLNECCHLTVVEAANNQLISRGYAYVAPGNNHLSIVGKKGNYRCKLDSGPKVNRHRPSVDVLFDSVNKTFQSNEIIAVILTGVGNDGAEGLSHLNNAGVYTIAQDEASSVVWGMPGSAVNLNAADEVLPLGKIASKLLKVPIRKASRREGG
ncbi:MAG: two-component system chemotaxis response regulator CheB [Candidatus Azotimanducaceae bacterium]